MKTLYVMDPLESLHLNGDSTYMMMLEANRRGWSPIGAHRRIYLPLGGQSYTKAIHVIVTDEEPFFEEDFPQDIDLGDV